MLQTTEKKAMHFTQWVWAGLRLIWIRISSPWRFFQALCFILGFFLIIGAMGIAVFSFHLLQSLPAVERQDFQALRRIAQIRQRDLLKNETRHFRWVELSEVSKELIYAAVYGADVRFFDQEVPGVSVLVGGSASAITRAVVASLGFFESMPRLKFFGEIVLSQQFEARFARNEILEIYLNLAEFAPGITGINAAAHEYFHKAPVEIDAGEGAYLATLLSQRGRAPASENETTTAMSRAQRNEMRRILSDMMHGNFISFEQYQSYSRFDPTQHREAPRERKGGVKRLSQAKKS